ncbi:50S ribosomal protein L15 [Phoenix dactylifera]|uniref:50S ribosomal protein L15 n=1 Tax=Phoenix dactylifera TaxID=42345 RepID=A0A8B9AMQ9_PHODC|nr:50S ribosomal protein L15 [Phoenix dactylifera]
MWRRLSLVSKLKPSILPQTPIPRPLSLAVLPLSRTLAPPAPPPTPPSAADPYGVFRASYGQVAGMGSSPATVSLLKLNDLRNNVPRKKKKRKGRGIGSGTGKTAGRGHKGQKARGTMKFGFEGGQTPLRRRLPRRGFKNPFSLIFQPVGLGKIAKLINAGKIDSSELITMKTLKDTGAIGKQIKDGVRLMGRGAEHIKWPIHFEVSRVTARAKAAVEAAGGSVRKVYYNKLGFQALLKPEWFAKKGRLLPRAARPPPKQRDKVDSIGRLPAPTKPIPFTAEAQAAA